MRTKSQSLALRPHRIIQVASRRIELKIGILGSGLMGAKLGTFWAKAGHDVIFSYARSEAKLKRLADGVENGQFGSVSFAVENSDVLLLAVHWSRIDDVLSQAGDLAGKVVVNCCVPLDLQNRDLVVGATTSGAEHLASLRPKARWVSAFNTTPSEVFETVFANKGKGERADVLYYGDDAGAKSVAADLISDMGFSPCDAGALRTARFCEPFAMITAELAYGQPGGPKLTYRFDKH
ncbi:NADPH-dependent F420 reductase [Thalassospira sp. HJ]|uniref:NADPH-dependent F420 reductase n=1 Tax=Thalassospira sp. HJ TaxID=1616823 RepID=UPI002101CFFE|nr:NAD(P)-binding domain-containing protein [Thalassospira sp. HJ]